MRTVSLAVFLAASLMAQDKCDSCATVARQLRDSCATVADSRLYRVSLGVLAVGHVADIASSTGGFEANPLLRGPDGRFSLSRGVWLKAATSGTSVVVQQILRRKQPREWHKYGKLFVVLNMGVGATAGVIAVRNWRVR